MNYYKIIGVFIFSVLFFGVEYENVTLSFALGGVFGGFVFTYILFILLIDFPLKVIHKLKHKEVSDV